MARIRLYLQDVPPEISPSLYTSYADEASDLQI